MKTHNISLINGFVLIIIGLFGYFASEARPITALIPVFFGAFIVLMNNGVKKENKLAPESELLTIGLKILS